MFLRACVVLCCVVSGLDAGLIPRPRIHADCLLGPQLQTNYVGNRPEGIIS
jgi:hypothetical protein